MTLEKIGINFRDRRLFLGAQGDVRRAELQDALLSKLRRYPQERQTFGVPNLKPESRICMYADYHEYIERPDFTSITSHREAFIRYVVNFLAKGEHYTQGDKEIESFLDIFHEEGLTLYLRALKEEALDRAYFDAVFNASTRFIPGDTWDKPVAIIIAGASGSGKSTATDRVITELQALPKKKRTNEHIEKQGNLITCIDGGVAREVSQMRKLAIMVSNELGYSGVRDLHEKSKAPLERVTKVIKEVVMMERNTFGILIPETYSHWFSPFSQHKEFMSELTKERRLIFSSVVPHPSSANFKEVVKYLANQRAWKQDNLPVIIDLNARCSESKAYAETGYYFGAVGSKSARDYYEQMMAEDECYSIIIYNDLVLMCEEPDTGWRFARADEPGSLMVSIALFHQWDQEPSPKSGLREYAQTHGHTITPAPLELSAALKKLLYEPHLNPAAVYRAQIRRGAPDSELGEEGRASFDRS